MEWRVPGTVKLSERAYGFSLYTELQRNYWTVGLMCTYIFSKFLSLCFQSFDEFTTETEAAGSKEEPVSKCCPSLVMFTLRNPM